MKKYFFVVLLQSLSIIGLLGCKKNGSSDNFLSQDLVTTQADVAAVATSLQCNAQAEQNDYSIYRMNSDGTKIGDMHPIYDAATGKFIIYYLKDIWNSTGQKHPWYAFTTTNLYSYSQTGMIIGSNTQTCTQDNAIGAGSVIKNGSTYYAFYTGHNADFAQCTNGTKREGIMLASSTNPTSGFTKQTSFATIYTPQGMGYDETDNWRDPYVIWDEANNNWLMLIMARKNHNGVWRGVIAKYTSSNLLNWTYKGVFYDGADQVYFNMECPQVFKMGNNYYLLYSDQSVADNGKKYVYYRKSSSLNGPWVKPSGNDRFDGNAFYAAKAVQDGYGDWYIFGWCHTLSGSTDAGSWAWGGNLVAHKIYADAEGNLCVAIPHTVKNWLSSNAYSIVKNSQWGNVTNTQAGTFSYRLVSQAAYDVANVIFNPIDKAQYMITANVSYTSANKDFGFMIGTCDGYENFYQLRFVPSENKFKFEKKIRSQLNATANNEIPLTLSPNTNYKIQIIIENSVVVVYINDKIAMTNRIYKASNTNWGIFTDNSDATFSNISVTYP